ncbi:MAG TPA: 16S rRNA (cytidine(1402)-2'-O)-methyltransferase [Candidatus Ornithospirochaeta avicola]|uniref:Ribosomal RNA small subunit methyltransferase I n=1 Tax=Candidatus Ornithospirochaeta avicola TaxID=2840896 RepID=A0A9D1PU73_9SPIO|nr:16S rRNA (cytidine(1402)-2'-O)-methyltransferase [Candidatus Ornithospirochaeta avicola]
MSTLYMVATPIGNLEDITLRALKVLKSVDVIACEDTRHTGNLLSHFDIKKKTISCHAHNEDNSKKGILALLDQGLSVAYCSDAGTPCLSDPGARLVEYIRTNSSHEIVPLPGANSAAVLISCAGNIGKTFHFEGFLPVKSGKRLKRLAELIARKEAFVILESPYRVLKTLGEVEKIDPSLKCVIGREMTKQFEEIRSARVSEMLKMLSERDSVKGEFTIVIAPGEDDDQAEED